MGKKRLRAGKMPAAVLFICMLFAFGAVLSFSFKKNTQPDTIPTGTEAAQQKTVYLTFDDGPSAVTEEILDYLKQESIPATFFVIGMETNRAEQLLPRMLEEGHSIGMHSYSHKYQQIYTSADSFFADLDQLAAYLTPIIGYAPDFFRFPGGSCNSTADEQVLEGIKQTATKRGLVWFDWNSVAEDSGASAADPGTMADNIISTGKDRDRILVLMHDNSVRTTAVDCLKIIVPYYREKGYQFAALTADTPPIQF